MKIGYSELNLSKIQHTFRGARKETHPFYIEDGEENIEIELMESGIPFAVFKGRVEKIFFGRLSFSDGSRWQLQSTGNSWFTVQDAEHLNLTNANKFNSGDTAYLCAGTIFGEKATCKTEVLRKFQNRIKLRFLTRCLQYSKGDTTWTDSGNAGFSSGGCSY